MDDLIALISENRNWLLERVLFYSCQQGYIRSGSLGIDTLRSFFEGISQSLIQALHIEGSIRAIHSDDKFTDDPASSLAIQEARLLYWQGIRLTYFLGLLKYYRQGYLDLLQEKSSPHPATYNRSAQTINRFFDRVELAFCTGWVNLDSRASLVYSPRGKEVL